MTVLKVSNHIDEAVKVALEDGLEANNIPFSGPSNWAPFQAAFYDEAGVLVGGLTGDSLNRWFKISLLWVRDDQQGKGLGQQLMDAAEAEARRRGDIGMTVKTYSYQAPEFYKKCGFSVFGTIEDYPPGYACLYLSKRF